MLVRFLALHSPACRADIRNVTDAAVVPTAAPVDNEAVVIRLGDGRFAAALDAVAEVGRVPSVTRIPGAPGWLAGVANWRGRLLPVLDLRPLLGAPDSRLGNSARLLVLSLDGVSAGIVVDSVDGTGALDAAVEEFPAALVDRGSFLLAGQVPSADGPIAVLDVHAVLRLREQLPRARRAG
jgi:purine-binding chemotaxis protein CheW